MVNSTSETLGWKAEPFREAFELDVSALESIVYQPTPEPLPQDEKDPPPKQDETNLISVELQDGSQLRGQLRSIDEDSILLDTTLFGTMRVQRTAAKFLSGVRRKAEGRLIQRGFNDPLIWSVEDEKQKDAWQHGGGSWLNKRGLVTAVGKINSLARSRIRLAFKVGASPDFLIALGRSEQTRDDGQVEISPRASFEVWDDKLIFTQSSGEAADFAVLADLNKSKDSSIELTLFLDKQSNEVSVVNEATSELYTLNPLAKRNTQGDKLLVTNYGSLFSLDRFELYEWDGVLPEKLKNDNRTVLGLAGKSIPGTIVGFDSAKNELIIQTPKPASENIENSETTSKEEKPTTSDEQHSTVRMPLDQLVRGAFTNTKSEAETKDASEESNVEIYLVDDSLLIGQWLGNIGNNDGKLGVRCEWATEPLKLKAGSITKLFSTSKLESINKPSDVQKSSSGKAETKKLLTGVLKSSQNEWIGQLQPDSPEGSFTSLYWQPDGSHNAVEIRDDASGSIKLLDQTSKPKVSNATAPVVSDSWLGSLFSGSNQGKTTSPSVQKSGQSSKSKPPHSIRFRSGDTIAATIVAIDESGVAFVSIQTKTAFVPHSEIEEITLSQFRTTKELNEQKQERLTTVPRALKNDPPTHLFIATNGDYLRGRLVELKEDTLTIEVRNEIKALPKTRIAQIVWLYDRQWDKQKDADGPEPSEVVNDTTENAFQIHAIMAGDSGITIQPIGAIGGILIGKSDLLGENRIELAAVQQILFGRDIPSQVAELKTNPWSLSLAIYPEVYQNQDSGEVVAGEPHPLVGQSAANFTLERLAGESYRLSERHDRVIVLDFWASWCGPCMATMPSVERVVNEIGEDKVELVAINIKESDDRAQAAIDRLKIKSTVLMDRDGQTAEAYGAHAIPETVVIDRQGQITEVFVGGSADFEANLRAAIEKALLQQSQ